MADDTSDRTAMDQSSRKAVERPQLQKSVVGAFIVGIALANFNKNLLLGFVIGSFGGIYAEQNWPDQFPDIKQMWLELKQKWSDSNSYK